MAVVHCSQCGAELPLQAELRFFLDDRRMCNLKCMHDAGSRAHCGPGCGCTAYAIKRRMLREHRTLIRCMDALIAEHGLDEELGALWRSKRDPRPGRAICLDYARLSAVLWTCTRSLLARVEALEAQMAQLSAPQ